MRLVIFDSSFAAPWPPRDPIRIALVVEHNFLRGTLRNLVATDPHCRIVGEATTCTEGSWLVMESQPDVVVVCCSLPEATRMVEQIRKNRPSVGIVMLVSGEADDYCPIILRRGADACLTKQQAAEELLDRIHALAKRG